MRDKRSHRFRVLSCQRTKTVAASLPTAKGRDDKWRDGPQVTVLARMARLVCNASRRNADASLDQTAMVARGQSFLTSADQSISENPIKRLADACVSRNDVNRQRQFASVVFRTTKPVRKLRSSRARLIYSRRRFNLSLRPLECQWI